MRISLRLNSEIEVLDEVKAGFGKGMQIAFHAHSGQCMISRGHSSDHDTWGDFDSVVDEFTTWSYILPTSALRIQVGDLKTFLVGAQSVAIL